MRQFAALLPADVPPCGTGHRASLVETHGAPAGHRIGVPCPPMFHIECHQCGLATVPTPNRALAESRWTDPTQAANRIPLHLITRARQQACAQLTHAA